MAYIYDLTDTWNASGTTFNGIKLNVTDSASASSSKLVTLQTNGTEHFSITKAGVGYVSGNLGVGTSSPATKLHLLTASATAVAVRAANSVSYAELQVDSSGNSQLLAPGGVQIFSTNGSERMRINSSGNVGIGTSVSYGSRLAVVPASTPTTVAGANQIQIGEASANTGYRMQLGYLNNGANGYNGSIQVYDNGNPEDLILNGAGGNVGIGTSSPTTKLQIGDISAADATYQGRIKLEDTSASLQTIGGLEFATSAFGAGYGWKINSIDSSGVHLAFGTRQNSATWSEAMRIGSSGYVLVGTTTLGGAGGLSIDPVGVEGASAVVWNRTSRTATSFPAIFRNGGSDVGFISYTNTAVAYNTTSDVRLKHDIIDAPEASSLIDAIQVRSFKWNVDDSEQRYGFVAQELVTVAPEAVSQPEDPDATMGVDCSKLVPMLVKELQSLRARVAELEGK